MAITLYTKIRFLSSTPIKALSSMTCEPYTVGNHTVYADAILIAHPLQIPSQHGMWTLHNWLSRCIRRCHSYRPPPFKSLLSMTCGPFTVGYHAVYADAIPIAHPLQIPSQQDMWTLHSWRSRCIRKCDSYRPPPSNHLPALHVDS